MLGIRPLARFRLRLSLHVCISEYGVVLGNLATCCSRCLFLALWSQRTRLSMTFAFSLWLQYQGQYQLLFIWRFLKMEVPQIINGWPWNKPSSYWATLITMSMSYLRLKKLLVWPKDWWNHGLLIRYSSNSHHLILSHGTLPISPNETAGLGVY